jgi:long-chain acyl-CoA synthetase
LVYTGQTKRRDFRRAIMNIATNLESSAHFFPNQPVIRQASIEITYAQLNDQANRIATGLIRLGIKAGDFVGLCTLNSADLIAFYFGVLKAGGVAVTLSGTLTGDELANLVRHANPRLIFTEETKLKEIEPLKGPKRLEKVICPGGDMDLQHLMEIGSGSFKARNRNPRDTAAILYTGGTTGTPKGVMRTHECITFSTLFSVYYERFTEQDTTLFFSPFNHVFGQHTVNSAIMSGGCLEVLPSFDMERALEAMEAGRITKFLAVPTVYIRLLTLPDLKKKLGRVNTCFSAAASLPGEIITHWRERTGIVMTEGYGFTEATPVTFNHHYREKHRLGSVGQPPAGVEVQIRDTSGRQLEQGEEGEICVRSRHVMKGYLNNPEGTRAAFWKNRWFRSGDIGRLDSDGYLYIVDRLKDLIITGAENVYPREVEEALYLRPEVEECAVVGLPDKEWGERVAAFIVPTRDHNVLPEELKSFLKTRLSPFKVPKEFITLRQLPKSPAGKILKREIKRQYIAEHDNQDQKHKPK